MRAGPGEEPARGGWSWEKSQQVSAGPGRGASRWAVVLGEEPAAGGWSWEKSQQVGDGPGRQLPGRREEPKAMSPLCWVGNFSLERPHGDGI